MSNVGKPPSGKRKVWPITFVPNLFKINNSKPQQVSKTDPFITDDAGQEYCSVLSKREDKMPNYLHHFKCFTENVLDISDDVLDDIAKMHVERELKFREEEKREEELLAQEQAIEMNKKNQLDKRVTSIMKANTFYVKRSCPVKIPFKSTLTHEEHEFYLRAFIKFQIWPPSNSVEQRDYEQYLSLQNKVFNEQTCLMNFSYKVSQLVLNEHNSIPSAMDNYISSYVFHRCERALSYPFHYKSVIEIPLKPQDYRTNPDIFQLTHIGHLLSMGSVPWLKMPPAHVKIRKDESVATKKRPDCDDEFDRNTYLYKCPVSEDPNAEYLAKVHKASIVMSASAFKTIVDNQEQTFDKEWNVPVKIKSYKSTDETGKEKDVRIMFVDKPLCRKSWLPLQKKATFFKAATKAQVLKVIKQPFFRMLPPWVQKPSPPRDQPPVYDDIFDNPTPPSPMKAELKRKRSPSPTDIVNDLLLSDDDEEELKKQREKRELQKDESQQHELQRDEMQQHEVQKFKGKKHKGKKRKGEKQPTNIMYPPPSFYHFQNKEVKPNQNTSQVLPPSSPTSPPISSSISSPTASPTSSPISPHVSTSTKLSEEEQKERGLLDNLLSKQDTFLKPKFGPGPSKETAPVPSSLSNYDTNATQNSGEPLKKPWTDTLDTDWDNFMIKQCPLAGGVNIHYQLFSFETTEQSPIKTERVEPMRIIVRHNIHGLTRFKKEHKSSKAFVLYPKVENQVYFGCEVNTVSEIVQQWAALVIRPHTTLLQIRICVDSGSIVMSEEKTLESILKEGKQNHLQFNPQSVYSTLNVLFNTCIKMSSGDYLLHHSPKTKAFINLLKAGDFDSSTSCMDLHKAYSDGAVLSRQYTSAPWLAIDTHVVTPFHMFHKKIPATFPMQNSRVLDRNERKRKTEAANKKMAIKGFE